MNSEKLNKKAQKLGFSSYDDFLSSNLWADRKAVYADWHPRKCFICDSTHVQLHHIRYDNMGNENDGDLVWLCNTHHEMVHGFPFDLATAHEIIKNMPASAISTTKEWFDQFIEKGAICPCCEAFTKLYKRKLNSGMAISLIRFKQLFDEYADEEGWIKVGKDYLPKEICLDLHHGEYSKMQHWSLLEKKNTSEGEAAQWRLTQLGFDFVNRKSRIPKYIHLKHGVLVKLSSETISINDALGDNFDYDELMSETSLEMTLV